MKKKLQLLIFCYSLSQGKGGAEKIAKDLINEMSRRGHKIFAGYCGKAQPSYALEEGVDLVPWRVEKESIKQYRSRVLDIRPDAFFVFYFNNELVEYAKLAWNTGIPFGMQECTNPERLCYEKWINNSGRDARSCWERELIASSATRIRMVMPGYELSFPQYIRQNVRAFTNSSPSGFERARPAGYDAKKKRIITIGGLKRNKNLALLLNAFALIKDDFPEWEIHCYGIVPQDVHPYHVEIFDLIDDKRMKNQIFFYGPTDALSEEYAKAHLHTLTSLSEGCPNCILEAMGQGLPSIGISSCQGTNRLIQHGENGLLVENDENGESMAQGLRELLSAPELREKMGQQAYEDSLQFEPEKTFDRWEQLFYEMAEYKNDPKRLLEEQMAVDRERALHMARCRRRYLSV